MSFTNRNICRNFTESLNNSTFKELNANGVNKGDGGAGQTCTEVLICHDSAGSNMATVSILDRWDAGGEDNAFVVPMDTPITFMGLTNCNQLSAKCSSGSGTLSYRTHYFSGTSQAVS